MIFYFSGTGNSFHAAKAAQERFGDDIVEMAAALKDHEFQYSFGEKERAIFVFPVYFGGVPTVVKDFIAQFEISGGDPEIVGIATCGVSVQGADSLFRSALKKKGLKVRAFYDVKMPQNCIFYLKVPIREAALMQLKRSNDRIRDILDSIVFNHRVTYDSGILSKALSRILIPVYNVTRGTSKFTVDDCCDSCGLCAEICPAGVIDIQKGKPVWTEKKCIHCAACINRCPQQSIQYGKLTKRRNRYFHPDLKKKTSK